MCKRASAVVAAQVIMKPTAVLGLATGSTPLGIYANLIAAYQDGQLNFEGIQSVNLDEYKGITPDNDQSYYYYMNTNLFSKINIKPENTNLPNGQELDSEKECKRYDAIIENLGGIDLQILGMGGNGHIGFNEPSTEFKTTTHCVALAQSTIEANARFFHTIDEVPTFAYTMGIKTIMQAKKILLVVNGDSKAEILKQALFGPVTPNVPASILQLHKDVTVVADEAALRLIAK